MQNRTRGVGSSSPKIGHPIILGVLALWFTKKFQILSKGGKYQTTYIECLLPSKRPIAL